MCNVCVLLTEIEAGEVCASLSYLLLVQLIWLEIWMYMRLDEACWSIFPEIFNDTDKILIVYEKKQQINDYGSPFKLSI